MTGNGYIDRNELYELRVNGKFKELFELVQGVHKEYPESEYVTYQYMMALIDYKPQELDEIKTVSDKILLTKYTPGGYFGLWFYYMSKNDLDNAAECYTMFKNDSYIISIYNRKLKYFKTAVEFRKKVFDIDFAISELETLDDTCRRYTYVTSDIADYYYDHEDYDHAIKYYKLSCDKRLGNTKGICYNKLGKCYWKKFDRQNALYYFKKAVEIALSAIEKAGKMPDKQGQTAEYKKTYFKYLTDYITALIDSNEFKEAEENIKLLDQGSEKDKNIAKQLRAKVFRAQGLIDEAVPILEELLTKTKTDRKSALIELMFIYYEQGNEEKMKHYLDIYNSEFGVHHIHLLNFYILFGYYDMALNHATSLLGGSYDELAKSFLGRIYNRLGNYEQAEYYLDQLEKNKLKSASMFEIAVAKEKLGKLDEAYEAYVSYITFKIKTKDKDCFNAGLVKLITMLNSSYKYDEAKKYIDVYVEQNPERQDEIDYLLANYYYRKQDYDNAITYFKKLYATKYETQAKNLLSVIYRFIGDKDSAKNMLDSLEKDGPDPLISLNRSKLLKDEHTKSSLMSALTMLEAVKETPIKAMVLSEQIPILIKLGMYNKALRYLEEANDMHVYISHEYKAFRSYIYYRLGRFDELEEDERSLFTCYSYNYGLQHALDSIINMNKCNQKERPIYMSDDELYHFYAELLHDLDYYDYYMDDLFDVYVIDMGKVIGSMFGVETTLLEVRCEMDTKKVHIISPTLKRINVNKRGHFTRKKTDLSEE